MKKAFYAIVLASLFTASVAADGPMISPQGKLFGMVVVPPEPSVKREAAPLPALAELYRMSGASVVVIRVSRADVKKQAANADYDFSFLDNNPLMKLAVEKIIEIDLAGPNISERDPEVEAFVTALAKYCNTKGIRYFLAPPPSADPESSTDWAQKYVEVLSVISRAVRSAGKNNILIAGRFRADEEALHAFYEAGARPYFDVLDIRAFSDDPAKGVDINQLISAHKVMDRNGDGQKKIFISQGWGPDGKLPGIKRKLGGQVSGEEIGLIRQYLNNGFRNLLTPRADYNPDWLFGALFSNLNDYAVGGTMGFGLADINGKQKDALVSEFPPTIPRHKMDARIISDSPLGMIIAGRPITIRLEFANLSDDQIEPVDIRLRALSPQNVSISKKAASMQPLISREARAYEFEVTFPKESTGLTAFLIGEQLFKHKDREYLADCWIKTQVIPLVEINPLPARLIAPIGGGDMQFGMSVINHSTEQLTGTIEIKPSAGVEVTPSKKDLSVAPSGLEAYVFAVKASGLKPGHYPLEITAGGERTTVTVTVPQPLSPLKEATVDGSPIEWVTLPSVKLEPRSNSTRISGEMKFGMDDKHLYILAEITDPSHSNDLPAWEAWRADSLKIAFDPLLDGPRDYEGGYRADDREYGFAFSQNRPVSMLYRAPEGRKAGPVGSIKFAFKRTRTKSVYEIAIPWAELAPYSPEARKPFGISVLANDDEGSPLRWGEGIEGKKNPGLFQVIAPK